MKIIKRKKLKFKLALIIVIIISLAVIGLWWYLAKPGSTKVTSDPEQSSSDTQPSTTVIATEDPVLHMAAMGDMLAHDTIIANATTETSYNFAHYFQNIRSSYGMADAVICNQEGPSSGDSFGISGYPSFNAPIEFAAGLQSGAGCNLINLANNHMGDKGVAATNATINVWDNLKPLARAGANKSDFDQNEVSYATVKGIKMAFLAFTDFNNNSSTPAYSVNNYHDESLVRSLVTQARLNADVVIVSMHWGVEDSNTVSSDQKNQANLLSSLGADVIIGTGPHVLQKVDTINRDDGGKTIVWYSLGNMLSSQFYTKELIGGIAQFDIEKSGSNTVSVSNLTFTPTYMHYEWTAAEQANNDLLARKNAMIYLLDLAEDPLSRSLLDTTVEVQKQYVIDTLGPSVTVK
jgi:poly-gamma-glutamate synthesis protein (capsule biosynthesis protein)